ncbi:hypothetical protein ABZ769_22330 [Streptomyces olivoreticuli]
MNTGHNNAGCGNIGSWFTQRARAGEYMCPYQPVPAGYRTGTHNASMCSGLGGRLLLSA